MTDFASMTARELRKIAPEHGVTGASRMTKPEIVEELIKAEVRQQVRDLPGQQIVDWVGEHLPGFKARAAARRSPIREPFDREARDALHRRSVVVYDPAGEIPEKQLGRRAALSRTHRRHETQKVVLLDGGHAYRRRALPKYRREAGLMVPVTKLALAQGKNRVAA